MKKHPLTLLLAMASGLATSITTHAAIITWGAAQNITGDSDVSLADSLVRAFNLGDSSIVASTTVNGVTFDPFGIPSLAPSVTIGNFTLANANGLRGFATNVPVPPFSSLSAPYQSLLRSYGSTNNGGSMTLTMFGLTVSQSYVFQWWANIDTFGAENQTTATAGNAITLDVNTSNSNGGLGQFAIGTFIADATGSQSITFSGSSNFGPTLDGFQLRVVPEPSTFAMLGLGLPALLAFRRRNRKA